MMNKNEFLQEFTKLCEVYDKKCTKLLAAIYYDILCNLGLDEFRQSIRNVLKDRVYTKMPMPADLLQQIEGTKDDKAMLQLNELKDALSSVGAYTSVCFKDKATMKAIKSMGGWQKLCMMTEQEWKFADKDFISLHKLYSKDNNANDAPQYFKGIHCHHNTSNGYSNEISISYIGFESGDDKPIIEYKKDKNIFQMPNKLFNIEG